MIGKSLAKKVEDCSRAGRPAEAQSAIDNEWCLLMWWKINNVFMIISAASFQAMARGIGYAFVYHTTCCTFVSFSFLSVKPFEV